ncbi:MAG: bifunctional demethylmenaquinone methyltransferase/2-methoxy-6-polyprenyl-1,4-benzoquinol methylase UbiE [Bacteroidetes bacterium]|nr:bifunctional demethylmenaquinone methyltransferase/2-methoxy-6-polyprenyl-1,4-benzoquinol methylase UbiE [Bacteroidota bacterium]
MTNVVTPYKNQTTSKKEQVAAMFDNIAPKYDFLNQLLSLGIHKGWRRKAIRLLQAQKPKTVLDIATGTADFAIEAMKLNPTKVVGVDISEGMLKLGRDKINKLGLQNKIELKSGDSENLPFSDNSFDAITVGFGVRNFENLEKGVADIYRVLNPDGMLVILEFSKPIHFPVKQVYNFYFRYITPLVGKLFSKDSSAYTYLPESVNAFPAGDEFLKILNKAGFKETKAISLTFGIASIYIARKLK